ncbi:MAG: hypothetical protein HFI70_05900 [Lachnospiraceae bacterium]|nr:hypothetical protein [Lachnospiraceae bacterium]
MRLEQTIGYESKEDVVQNLRDAGCSPDTIRCFMEHFDQGDWKDQLELLEEHRENILNRVHEEERQIDCLDYLVYQIRNRKKLAL